MLFWRDGVFEILKINGMTEMNSINSHCGMVRECRIDSFVHSTTNYEHKNTSDMKRNFMQSKIVKQLSIINLQLSVANCTLLIVFCFLFGGKAWGQTTLWSEDFEGGSLPSGWTTSGNGSWSVATNVNSTHPSSAGHGTYCAQIKHGTTGNATKLITPTINLSAVTSAELSLMRVNQSWAGDIDELKIYYRTSTSGTWTLIESYTDAQSSWNTESGIVLPNLTSTYQLAFEYIDNYGYGLGIDYVQIVQGASCPKPTALSATTNVQNATITWIGSAGSYDIARSTNASASPDDCVVATGVSSNSYDFSSLSHADHYVWVRADCGGNGKSNWTAPVSFYIGYCNPAPTSIDNSGVTNITFGTGSNVVNNSTHPTSSPYYGDYTAQIGAVEAGVQASMSITYATGYTYNTYVWVDLNNNLTFEASEVVCYGESTNTNPTTLELNFTIPANQTPGDYRMRIGGADSGLGSNPNNANPCYSSTYGIFEDYTLRVLAPPSCLIPTGLALSTNGTTMTATWNANVDAIDYNVSINGTVYPNATSTNSYTFDVNLSTNYTVMVEANCAGSETSGYCTPVSLTTPDCIGGHTIEYTLTDSYNDGWEGSSIRIVDGCGNTIQTLTVASGDSPLSGTLTLCGSYYEFVYTQGNYPSEYGWTFTEGASTLFTGNGNDFNTGDVLHTLGTLVPAPTSLTAGTPGMSSVVLNWTENGTASSWQICINGDENNLITANTNVNYILSGLNIDTDYTVKVRAYIDANTQSCWSNSVNFTTEASNCPKPTNVTAGNLTVNSANISWNGNADSYNVQYATATVTGTTLEPVFFDDFENGFGNWTTYALGEYTGDTWALTNSTSLVDYYPSGSYGALTRSYYNGVDVSVDNWLVSPQMTLGDVLKFWVVGDNNNYQEYYAVYVSTNTNATGDFVFVEAPELAPGDGTWAERTVDLSAYAGQQGYIAIRHTDFAQDFLILDDFGVYKTVNSYSYGPFTSLPPTTETSCNITGLSSETLYVAQVQSDCDGDGTSGWSSVYFTTPDACSAPTDLVASNITTTTATLGWSDNQDSYNVQYRKVYFFESFEGENLPTGWTTIDANSDGNCWTVGHATTHSGSNGAANFSYIYGETGTTPDDYLISPLLDLQGTLRVWLSGITNSNYEEYFSIYVSTTGNTVSDFTSTTPVCRGTTTNQYVEYTADLSSYAGQQGYIAIRHHNCSDQRYLYVDDFGLYGSENWVSVSPNPTDATASLSGLSAGTDYEWQVQGISCNNNGDNTSWSATSNFTTLCSIAASVSPAAAGSITGAGDYARGSTCSLTATADDCYNFVNWTDENDAEVSTDATYSFTVTGSRILVANFTLNNYSVTVDAGEGGSASQDGNGTYACGTTATLSATPSDGYCFAQWSDGETANPREVTVTEAASYTANFTHYLEVSNIANVDYCVTGEHAAVSAAPTAGSGDYTYTWQMYNGSSWGDAPESSSSETYNPPYSTTGTVSYKVSVADNNGCAGHNSVVKEFSVKVSDVPSITLPAPTVCSGSALTFVPEVETNGKDLSSSSYQISADQSDWSEFTNGLTVTNEQNNNYIKYTATNGCGSSSQTVQVAVNSPSVGTLSADDYSICPGEVVSLAYSATGSVVGELSCEWKDASNNTVSDPTSVKAEGLYTANVTATNTVNGLACTATGSASGEVSYKVPTSSERTTMGIDNEYYIWTGNGESWADSDNWMRYTSSDGKYTLITAPNSSSANVVVGKYEACASRYPDTLKLVDAGKKVQIIKIASGAVVYSSSKILSVYGNMVNNGRFDAPIRFRGTTLLSGNGTNRFRGISIYDANSSFTSGDGDITIYGNWTNNGTYTAGTGKIIFTKTSTIAGDNATTFKNVQFNKSNGKFTISTEPTITGTATFTKGIVSGDITFASTGTSTGASTSSYVDGTVTKNGNGSSFTFPTGANKVLGTITATIANEQSATARFHHKTDGFTQEDGYPRWWNVADMCGADPFNHVSNFEYWDFTTTANLTNVKFVSKATAASAHFNDPSTYPDLAHLDNVIQVAVYDECWKNAGGNLAISADYKTITISGVNASRGTTRSGSVITTFGSKDPNVVLPIELTSFTATCDGRSALVEWTTATERNNDYFSLERSDDAINFTEIARVAGAGNSIELLDYSYTDYGIHGGDNYYRLVQVDYDGTRTASEIIVANCIESVADGEPEVVAYPNPFNDELTVVLDNFGNRAATIEVYDMLGKLIYTEKVSAPQNSYETILSLSNLPSGAYTVRVSTTDFVINKNVVKQ
jgi:hypothetical protein